MNNRKELAELIHQWADNPESYFMCNLACNPTKTKWTPTPESNLSDWKLIIPPKKWGSKYHEKGFYVEANGNVEKFDDVPDAFQNELLAQYRVRENKEQAEDLAKLLKEIATIDAWACEFKFKKAFKYGNRNYYIFHHIANNLHVYTNECHTKNPGRVYMTEEGCKLLCEKIKSGEVELP